MRIIGNRLLIRRKPIATSIETPYGSLEIPQAVIDRNPAPFFEATVVDVGNALSESVAVGDDIVVQHCGSQKVVVGKETLELVSMFDVFGVGTL